ncbi:DUF2335 domain-containing protein [Stenotrophomonas sp.]|uniref:DUF2335 domain-containing protein n=1 Tax=Stenotrophomonas sp. TaxID=69392 RepID=UPI00289C02D7|nr:DUF2335 domain-containing protein [Stenotrophomonas sp.]
MRTSLAWEREWKQRLEGSGMNAKNPRRRKATGRSKRRRAAGARATGLTIAGKSHRQAVVGEAERSHSVTRHVLVQERWQGPVPSPATLAGYEDVLSGLADRIIRMAEQEGAHSRLVEVRTLNWSIVSRLVGQAFGAGLAVACLLLSYRLAVFGEAWVAAILGGTTLTTVVLAFLQWRRGPSKA